MNDLENILNESKKLNADISRLLKKSTYREYDDMSGLKINYQDSEELFLLDELRSCMEKLNYFKSSIDYLDMPIVFEGFLHKNSNGRYECDKHEYTSGNGIEVLIYDDFYEIKRWVKTRVEHNGKDYYLVGYKDVSMEGLKIRIRAK